MNRRIEQAQRILRLRLAGALDGIRGIGEPALLAAFAVAVRAAAGGLRTAAASVHMFFGLWRGHGRR